MDPDFMNNLNNMMNNGNIPDDIKNMLNSFKNRNNDSNTNTDSDTSNNSTTNPDMLKNIMNMFNSNTTKDSNQTDSSDNSNSMPNIDMNMIFKMKSIMDKMNNTKNDPRSNLLLSLKPYLKDSRKSKIEQYIQIFNMSNVMGALNNTGGENTK